MDAQTVRYTDDRWSVSLSIRPARMVDATRRTLWQGEALKARTNDPATDYLRIIVQPDLCAAIEADKSSLTVDGQAVEFPITRERFEQLPEMPDELINAWWDAVYTANPHWREAPIQKSLSDDLYRRLAAYNLDPSQRGEREQLPDVALHDLDRAWSVFTVLEAIEWKWPPDVIERQDDRLMRDLITIAGANSRVKESMRPHG